MVDVETWANGETNRSIGEVEVIGRCDSVRENGRENEGEREREREKQNKTNIWRRGLYCAYCFTNVVPIIQSF